MFDPNYRPVTLRDIAKQLGVSHTTVSLALKGSPRVSEKLRQEIQDFAEKVNYRPDPLLQQLASYKKKSSEASVQSVIAWLNDWERPEDFFKLNEYNKYFEGACSMAEKLGYRVEVFRTHKNDISQKRLSEILSARGIRGIIVPPHPLRYTISREAWNGFAVLRIGFNNPSPRNHVVGSDQFEGGRLAAKEMLEAGYRRIGYIGNRPTEERMRYNFLSGFRSLRDCLVDEGDQVPNLLFNDIYPTDGKARYSEWLEKHRVDAVLTNQLGTEEWTTELGLEFGKDLGLAGTSITDSILDSGINQKPLEIGAISIQFIAQLIAHYQLEIPEVSQRLLVSPSWVSGSSLLRDNS